MPTVSPERKSGNSCFRLANLVPDDEVSDVNILPEAFDPRVADVVSKAVIDHIEK